MRRRAATALPLIALAGLLSACTFTGPAMTIEYRSPQNKEIWELYSLVFWLATAVFIVVETALLYSVIRFRRRPGDGLPRQVHGNNKVEIAWTIAPALLLVIVAIPTVRTIIHESTPPPSDALHVQIIGHQFWWEVVYPDQGVTTANEIHLPVNRPVAFDLTSADVQHSFWVPKLMGKLDLYPNRHNTLTFTPEVVDTYFGQCAELCGAAHGFMKMRVMVQPENDFNAWVRGQKAPAMTTASTDLVKKGEQLVTNGACIGCHYIEGTNAKGKVGPNLTHFGSRTTMAAGWIANTPENVMRWVANPDTIKPGVLMPAFGADAPEHNLAGVPRAGQYTQDDLAAIAAYLESLK